MDCCQSEAHCTDLTHSTFTRSRCDNAFAPILALGTRRHCTMEPVKLAFKRTFLMSVLHLLDDGDHIVADGACWCGKDFCWPRGNSRHESPVIALHRVDTQSDSVWEAGELVISTLEGCVDLRNEGSAVFFKGNSLSDPKDLLREGNAAISLSGVLRYRSALPAPLPISLLRRVSIAPCHQGYQGASTASLSSLDGWSNSPHSQVFLAPHNLVFIELQPSGKSTRHT